MTSNTAYIEIIKACLKIDKTAQDIYFNLSKKATVLDLEKFWEDMALDEQKHAEYWEHLLAMLIDGSIPNIFDNTHKVHSHLENVLNICDKILHASIKVKDSGTSFLLAYRLEFYLLHPAFGALFHLMGKDTGSTPPDDEYDKHIRKFIDGFNRFNQGNPYLGLFVQFLEKIWEETQAVSDKIGSVCNLEGLIPVCSDCKKIFSENGTWETMDYFIRLTMGTSFTHWICPECLQKNYPEYYLRIIK